LPVDVVTYLGGTGTAAAAMTNNHTILILMVGFASEFFRRALRALSVVRLSSAQPPASTRQRRRTPCEYASRLDHGCEQNKQFCGDDSAQQHVGA
jgi:hypothetical protein